MSEKKKISVERAREAFQRVIHSVFKRGGPYARFSIPADPDNDDDLVLSDFIAQSEAMRAEIERLKADADAVKWKKLYEAAWVECEACRIKTEYITERDAKEREVRRARKDHDSARREAGMEKA